MRTLISVVVLSLLFLLFPLNVFADFDDVYYYSADDYSSSVVHPYYENGEIKWLEENGIVLGYEDNTFGPDNPINRAEFLKILYLSLGYGVNQQFDYTYAIGEDTFSDLPDQSGYWYQDYVSQAYADGIIDGYSDGTLKPANTINFAEASKIIVNMVFGTDAYNPNFSYGYCNLDASYYRDEWFYGYISILDGSCIYPDNLWQREGYHPGLELTRGDMATLIYRALTVRDNSDDLSRPKVYVKYEVPEDLSSE